MIEIEETREIDYWAREIGGIARKMMRKTGLQAGPMVYFILETILNEAIPPDEVLCYLSKRSDR